MQLNKKFNMDHYKLDPIVCGRSKFFPLLTPRSFTLSSREIKKAVDVPLSVINALITDMESEEGSGCEMWLTSTGKIVTVSQTSHAHKVFEVSNLRRWDIFSANSIYSIN